MDKLVYSLGIQTMPSPPIIFSEHICSKGVPMALKIVYKICCGIDVHKTFVVACIASTNDKGVTSYESHRFSTYTSGRNFVTMATRQELQGCLYGIHR